MLTKYRVIIKSFPDYKHLLQEKYMEYMEYIVQTYFFLLFNSTKEVFLQLT
jgi:hypothetical protein